MVHYDLRDMDVVITHHGVKGQKWGVRRALTATGHIVGSTYNKASEATKKAAETTGKAVAKGSRATGNAIVKGAKVTGTAIAKKTGDINAERVARKTRGVNLEKRLANPKKIKKMSDEQLKTYTNRLNMENTLNRLSKSTNDKKSKKLYRNRLKLSDQEIKKVNDRLQMEDNLRQQVASAKKDSNSSKLGRHAMNVMGNVAVDVMKQQLSPNKKRPDFNPDSLNTLIKNNAYKETKQAINDSQGASYKKAALNLANDKIWGKESQEGKKKKK